MEQGGASVIMLVLRYNGAGGSECNNVSLVVARIYFSSSKRLARIARSPP